MTAAAILVPVLVGVAAALAFVNYRFRIITRHRR